MQSLVFKRQGWNGTLLLFTLIVLIFAGCALKVKLVGQYDDIVDKSVHKIESRTNAQIKLIIDNEGKGDGSYAQSKKFYSDVEGEIQALIVRAESLEEGLKVKPLTKNFRDLNHQYDDFEILHKTPYNKNAILKAQEAFDQSFRAIVKHLVYLKWNQKQPSNN